MRARLEGAFERFLDVGDLDNMTIANRMRELGVDIAVDLTGYTDGSRPGILALRPSPVQASYLGFSGTMGSEFIDYIIADRVLVPEDHEANFTERVARLPDTFLVFDSRQRRSEPAPIRAEHGLPETGLVFCAFNGSYKITPIIFDIWMRLLRAVDGSILWLSRPNEWAAAHLRQAAELQGIDGERLIFAKRVERREDHLARQRLADLFLDTLPYNAHSTAAEALWAGLPVLTCRGETFAGRVAASLLYAVGLPELVTENLADYEALALKLAREPAMLAEIKARLARNRDTFPLFDTARFTRHIEAAYTTMWEINQRGEAPKSFTVEPL
jgi:protein O-GlcNAc transferase